MSFLPQNTPLGNLEIFEVYELLDKPVLFSCKNDLGQLFLVVWEDEDDDSDTWLYVELSNQRFEQLSSGEIDLKAAFQEAASGLVYEIVIKKDNSAKSNILAASLLPDDRLPLAGEFLPSLQGSKTLKN